MDLSSKEKLAPIGMPKRKRETPVYKYGKSIRDTLSKRDYNLSVSVEGVGGQIQFLSDDPTIEEQLIDNAGDVIVTSQMARKLTQLAKLKMDLVEAMTKHEDAANELASMISEKTGEGDFIFER